MATHPKKAAAMAIEKEGQLRKGFQKLLEQHGIEGWHLTSFHMEPAEATVQRAAACPPGTTFDCRLIDGKIVCDCFPD
ncbi:MAG: hypothetical protein ACJ71U_15570 [Terriglobales bacterium]